jgi:molybdopterin-guanine dinucleotide biosynthesis adapter protein
MIDYPLPILGFCAFSGTGKTTLLKKVLPILRLQGKRIVLVKHAHHKFEIDHPKKDSYELRKAGAIKTLVASRKRMALVTEFSEDHPEPTLNEALSALDPNDIDLVLVEGFKREAFPKIELHRSSLGKPLLCLHDSHIIAVASDSPIPEIDGRLPLLNLNDPAEIASFIKRRCCPPSGKDQKVS